MRKTWMMMAAVSAAIMLTATGCEKEDFLKYIPTLSKNTEDSATATEEVPVATPTPTAAPTATPTPVPTATLAPRLIGVKNASSRSIMLTNNVTYGLREFYVRVNGYSSWNNNLIPPESIVRNGEIVTMCYTPDDSGYEYVTYDIRIGTRNGYIFDIYDVKLQDMDSAVLGINDDGMAFLRYTSLESGEETSTDTYYYDSYYDSSYDYDYDYDSSYDYDYDYDSDYDNY